MQVWYDGIIGLVSDTFGEYGSERWRDHAEYEWGVHSDQQSNLSTEVIRMTMEVRGSGKQNHRRRDPHTSRDMF